MLSIPRTISRAVNVAKATQACGSLNHSIQNTYLLNLPRLQHGEDIRAKVRATVLFGQELLLYSGIARSSDGGLVILSKRCISCYCHLHSDSRSQIATNNEDKAR